MNVTHLHYYCLVIHGVHENLEIDDVDSLPPCVRGQGRKHRRLKDFFVRKLFSEKTLAKGTKELFKAQSKPCQEQDNGVDCLLYSLMYIEFESMGIVTNEDPTKGYLVGTSGYLTADMYQIRELAVLSMLQCCLITDTSQQKFNDATKATMQNLCAILKLPRGLV